MQGKGNFLACTLFFVIKSSTFRVSDSETDNSLNP
jgi:hypothetical protein